MVYCTVHGFRSRWLVHSAYLLPVFLRDAAIEPSYVLFQERAAGIIGPSKQVGSRW